MNYFDPKSAAERYARGRPYFHPQVIGKIKGFFCLAKPVPNALDIACGTGLSTIALKELAHKVFGTDISFQMIALAPKEEHINYLASSAEELPFKDSSFQLLTISSALHWIDRGRLFSEAKRVLVPQGRVIVYDNGFRAKMEENPDFQKWCLEVHVKRYPSPPRRRTTFSSEDTDIAGFQFLGQEQYENTVCFSVDELVDYMLTQTNVIAAVEGGHEHISDIRAWLMAEVAPKFINKSTGTRMEIATFHFGGPIWYMQKNAS